MNRRTTTRRWILRGGLAAGATGVGLLHPWLRLPAQAGLLPPTPSCDESPAATIASTAGPFYTPDTPRKRDFRGDAPGEPLTLAGHVVDRRCQPLAGAFVDLWHADARGAYDNAGYRLRGHQLTDAEGRYHFETIVPGYYGRRTRHYHVKVKPRGEARMLTTQLYFPGEGANERDFLFDPRLLMEVQARSDGAFARFDFILSMA
jgi:protocatechuate 3,4-dioxygenase beta subunit